MYLLNGITFFIEFVLFSFIPSRLVPFKRNEHRIYLFLTLVQIETNIHYRTFSITFYIALWCSILMQTACIWWKIYERDELSIFIFIIIHILQIWFCMTCTFFYIKLYANNNVNILTQFHFTYSI